MKYTPLFTLRLVRWYPLDRNARALPWSYRSSDRRVRAVRVPWTWNVDTFGQWYALAVTVDRP